MRQADLLVPAAPCACFFSRSISARIRPTSPPRPAPRPAGEDDIVLLGRRQVRLEPVVVLLRDRLQLVVVAAGTADRQSEERGADDVGALGQDLVAAQGDVGIPRVPPHRAEPVEDGRRQALRGPPARPHRRRSARPRSGRTACRGSASRSRSRGSARRRGCGDRIRSPRSRRSGPRPASAAPSARRNAGWPAAGRPPARRHPATGRRRTHRSPRAWGEARSGRTSRGGSIRPARPAPPAATGVPPAVARMKASIGLCTQAASWTRGGTAFLTGWNAQWDRACWIVVLNEGWVPLAAG